jgi:hypothetical protein
MKRYIKLRELMEKIKKNQFMNINKNFTFKSGNFVRTNGVTRQSINEVSEKTFGGLRFNPRPEIVQSINKFWRK